MLSFRPLARVQALLTRGIGRLSQARAVAAQANVTGGALNTAAQSSVQTERDRLLKDRREFLLGRAHSQKLAIEAPHEAHLEAKTDEGQARARLRRRPPKQGQGGRQQGHHESDADRWAPDEGPTS